MSQLFFAAGTADWVEEIGRDVFDINQTIRSPADSYRFSLQSIKELETPAPYPEDGLLGICARQNGLQIGVANQQTPAIRNGFIPRPNFRDSSAAPRIAGSTDRIDLERLVVVAMIVFCRWATTVLAIEKARAGKQSLPSGGSDCATGERAATPKTGAEVLFHLDIRFRRSARGRLCVIRRGESINLAVSAADQFRPDFLPVVGAQILSGDNALGCSLNRDTSLWRDRRCSTRHLREIGWGDANRGRQFRCCTALASGDVGLEFHSHQFRTR